jgi:hypothetical protein
LTNVVHCEKYNQSCPKQHFKMHVIVIPITAMISEDLTHRAAVRTRKKNISLKCWSISLQFCPAAILINCTSDLCRMCQKHTINNITGTVCAVTTKKQGRILYVLEKRGAVYIVYRNQEPMGNLGNKCDKYDPKWINTPLNT